MEFIDLKAQQQRLREQIDANIAKVLDHGQYILGPEVAELERTLAAWVGVKHCIGVASGTDALLVALMALDIAPGDEVVMPAFNYVATAEVTALLNAKPVYADVDAKTYNLDPDDLARCLTAATNAKAVVPVSMFGQCADYERINQVAAQHAAVVIEDAAQSFGATQAGRRSCALTTIATTSFFPAKPLGAYGDGGAIFTDNDDLAAAMRQIAAHGQSRRYYHTRVGINGRLDTMQAAVLLAKFGIFAEELDLRQQVASRYNELLTAAGFSPPVIAPGNLSAYAQYTIEVEGHDRDALRAELTELGIPTAVHYPLPLHQQPAVADATVQLPHSEAATRRVISLPMHPYLRAEQQQQIVAALAAAAGKVAA